MKTKQRPEINSWHIQRRHNGIVKHWPEVRDGLVLTVRMNAVGKQQHNNAAVQLHPHGNSGKSQMADGPGGKPAAAAGAGFCRDIKPERPSAFLLRDQHRSHRLLRKDPAAQIALVYLAQDTQEIGYGHSRAKQPRLAIHTPGLKGVVIMHHSFYQTPPPRAVLCSGKRSVFAAWIA